MSDEITPPVDSTEAAEPAPRRRTRRVTRTRKTAEEPAESTPVPAAAEPPPVQIPEAAPPAPAAPAPESVPSSDEPTEARDTEAAGASRLLTRVEREELLTRRRRRRGRGSLAREYGRDLASRPIRPFDEAVGDAPALPKDGPVLYLWELQQLSVPELVDRADLLEVMEPAGLRRSELIREILLANARRNGPIHARGLLEMNKDGSAFLRAETHHYQHSIEDILVPPPLVRRHGLRPGDLVEGELRGPRPKDRFFALGRIDRLNGEPLGEERRVHPAFDDLKAVFPRERLILERVGTPNDLLRVADLVTPLGKGQRVLILGAPRTGKTPVLRDFAAALAANHAEVEVLALLVDERPEVAQRFRDLPRVRVVSPGLEHSPEQHFQSVERVQERARRLAEMGRDVVVLVDDVSRLVRACGGASSARLVSDASEGSGLRRALRFFATARKLEKAGSITVIAAARTDSGNATEEAHLAEFRSLCNAELVLDRGLLDQGVRPHIHIGKSLTREADTLLHPEELARVETVRNLLREHEPADAMEMLVSRLRRTKTNAEFLMSIQVG